MTQTQTTYRPNWLIQRGPAMTTFDPSEFGPEWVVHPAEERAHLPELTEHCVHCLRARVAELEAALDEQLRSAEDDLAVWQREDEHGYFTR